MYTEIGFISSIKHLPKDVLRNFLTGLKTTMLSRKIIFLFFIKEKTQEILRFSQNHINIMVDGRGLIPHPGSPLICPIQYNGFFF